VADLFEALPEFEKALGRWTAECWPHERAPRPFFRWWGGA